MILYVYLGCFLLLLYFLIGRNRNYWKSKGIPFDKPFLFFGSLYSVVTGKEHFFYRIRSLYEKYKNPYVGIYIFTKPYLMLRDPEMIKKVLVKDSEKFLNRNIVADEKIDPLAAHALFTSKDSVWKNTRTKMSPVFTSGKIKLMFPLMKECSKDLIEYLQKNNGKIVNMRDMTKRYTVDVIASCAFGINAFCLKDKTSLILKMTTQLFDFKSIKRNFSVMCYFFLPSFVNLFKLKFLDKEASDYLGNVFKTTMKEREEKNIVRNDLVDLLSNLKKKEVSNSEFKFDDVKMAAQAITFLSAGNDTTSTMMTFTFYELALQQDIQDRLRKEVTECFEKDGDFTYENVQGLKYLDMVFNEALRKYPLTIFLDRRAKETYTFEEQGTTVDEGTSVLIPVAGLHYDPENYPNPEKFDPERFSDENKRNIKPYTFLPFGEGPRICIGQRFAYVVSKLGIAYAVKDFVFEPAESTDIPVQFESSSIFLISRSGVPLKVTKV